MRKTCRACGHEKALVQNTFRGIKNGHRLGCPNPECPRLAKRTPGQVPDDDGVLWMRRFEETTRRAFA